MSDALTTSAPTPIIPAMSAVFLTYYVDLMSSWCTHVEPVWDRLQKDYADRVAFTWKIALMNPGDFPASRAQCDWVYRRSGTITREPSMLNSGWFDAQRQGDFVAPNLVAEAARSLGHADDRARRILAQAGLRAGAKIGDLDVSLKLVAKALKLDLRKLRTAAQSKLIRDRVATSTAEFHAHQINQRPAFIATDAIGDKAVFSGLVKYGPIAATLEAMLDDCAAYASYAAHHGSPPVQ